MSLTMRRLAGVRDSICSTAIPTLNYSGVVRLPASRRSQNFRHDPLVQARPGYRSWRFLSERRPSSLNHCGVEHVLLLIDRQDYELDRKRQLSNRADRFQAIEAGCRCRHHSHFKFQRTCPLPHPFPLEFAFVQPSHEYYRSFYRHCYLYTNVALMCKQVAEPIQSVISQT